MISRPRKELERNPKKRRETNYFYLYFANQEVSVNEEWTSFLKTMVEKRRFTAESATQWAEGAEPYPWETTQEYLQTLLSEGFLERVTV